MKLIKLAGAVVIAMAMTGPVFASENDIAEQEALPTNTVTIAPDRLAFAPMAVFPAMNGDPCTVELKQEPNETANDFAERQALHQCRVTVVQ